MCKDQNWTSETDRATERPSKRMKIEKPGVGRPLLGPAKILLSGSHEHSLRTIVNRDGKQVVNIYFEHQIRQEKNGRDLAHNI